jgi:hypothetical protein
MFNFFTYKNKISKLLFLVATLLVSGCSTSGYFVITDGTQLVVYRRPVNIQPGGRVVTRPFFWTATGIPPHGGCTYRLLKDNKVIKEGTLRVKFRPVSIFWPPFAVIYWPIGLNQNIIYDLVNDTQK